MLSGLLLFSSLSFATDSHSTASTKKTDQPVFGPDGFGELKLGMHWKIGNPIDRLIRFSGNPASFEGCIFGHLNAENEPTEPFAGAYLSKKMGLVSISAYKGVYTKERIGIGI